MYTTTILVVFIATLSITNAKKHVWEFEEKNAFLPTIDEATGEIGLFEKQKNIILKVPRCHSVRYVYVMVDNPIAKPTVDYDRETKIVSIKYRIFQHSKSTYQVVAKGTGVPGCDAPPNPNPFDFPVGPVPQPCPMPYPSPNVFPSPSVFPCPSEVPVPDVYPSPNVYPSPSVVPVPDVYPSPNVYPSPSVVPVPDIYPSPNVYPSPSVYPSGSGPVISPSPSVAPSPLVSPSYFLNYQ